MLRFRLMAKRSPLVTASNIRSCGGSEDGGLPVASAASERVYGMALRLAALVTTRHAAPFVDKNPG